MSREVLQRLAYLSHLTLSNFRSLLHLELELPEGVLVFFGPNAQGKTTLLEAVYLLAIARSFRAENGGPSGPGLDRNPYEIQWFSHFHWLQKRSISELILISFLTPF